MRAVLLAAGRGSRMGNATADEPKCLTVVCGRPLISWQLEAMRVAGIRQIAVVRGYLKEKLALPGVTTFDNARWSQTNMVKSLACAGEWLDADECVVSYTDILYPAATIRALADISGDIALTYYVGWRQLWEKRFTNPLSDAESFRVDASGRLLEIGARPRTLDEIQGQYMGLLRFTPRGWSFVREMLASMDSPAQDRLDMTSLLSRLLQHGREIVTVPTAEPWYEVDTQADLDLCHAIVQRRGRLF